MSGLGNNKELTFAFDWIGPKGYVANGINPKYLHKILEYGGDSHKFAHKFASNFRAPLSGKLIGGGETNTQPTVQPLGFFRHSSKFTKIYKSVLEVTHDVNAQLIAADRKASKYCYVIEMYGHATNIFGRFDNSIHSETFFSWMDKDVLDDIRNGNCALVISNIAEGTLVTGNWHPTVKLWFEYLHEDLEKYNLPPSSIFLVINDYLLKSEYYKMGFDDTINILATNYYLDVYSYHSRVSIDDRNMILSKWKSSKSTLREHHFLSYNRMPRPHRRILLSYLHANELFDKGIVSAGEGTEWETGNKILSVENFAPLSSSYNVMAKEVPITVDLEGFNLPIDYGSAIFEEAYTKTYFNIITETDFLNPMLYFTEKIYKTIPRFHPFILVGQSGMLRKFKEFGFKTFHPFINEAYDDEINGGKRMMMIFDEIEKLCSMSKSKIHDWYWNMEDILEHNYRQFLCHNATTTHDYVFGELYDFLYGREVCN